MNNRLFDFVREFSNELADLAYRIEVQLLDQPQAALIHARLYCEKLVKKISDTEGLEAIYPLKPAERIHKLYRQDITPEEIYLKLEWIRKMGNKAAHEVKEIDLKDVLEAHKLLFEISVWYMEVYVSHQFTAPKYQLPVKVDQTTNHLGLNDLDALIKPYFDQTLQKVDEMREVFERELEAIKVDKEKNPAIFAETGSTNQRELKEPTQDASFNQSDIKDFALQYKEETILLSYNLAETPILDLPIIGCNYLLRELSRVGIDSLAKIIDPIDLLHMKLNGIGTSSMEKFWNQLGSLPESKILEAEVNKCKEDDDRSKKSSEKKLPLSKEKENTVYIFLKNNFVKTYETTKAIEFEHLTSKEVVYLMDNKETSIVLHPNMIGMSEHLISKGTKRSSTALKQFPKEKNKGENPINYGYLFKFGTDSDLETFLKNLNEIYPVEINN